MSTRTFIWISLGGGAWSIAANWDDLTDGVSPSQLMPGAQDSISVPGPTGESVQTITGNGAVATALFTGNTILSGNFTASSLTAGLSSGGGLLQLAAGTSLQAGSATLTAGSLLVNGTATQLGVAGLLTLGSTQAGPYGASANLNVTAGGHAAVLGVLMDTANSQIYVDASSIMEVGSLGTAAAGKLTIDPGEVLVGQGDANPYGAVANNGTIDANGGTLALGTLSGTGSLLIESGATLELEGGCGSGQLVQFEGVNATLEVDQEFFTPAGTVTGFAPGDSVDFTGSLISSASFTPTGATCGVLTLYYANQVAASINLAGNYIGDAFLTSGDGAGGTLIQETTSSGGGGTAPPGTGTRDQYEWSASGGGAWSAVSNWTDETTGASPAAVAPGLANLVTIAAPASSFIEIAGPANAYTLDITGDLALTGGFGVNVLNVGSVAADSFTQGALDLIPGTHIGANGVSIGAGEISVAGAGAVLAVFNTLTLGGGISGVGLPVTALDVTSGGTVRTANLAIGGGSGDTITVDPASSLEVGTLGGAASGAVTVDPGATLAGNGSIDPFGNIIDNGSIVATGDVLTLGSVTGTGALSIGAGALDLNAATAIPIAFTTDNGTLAFAGAGAAPTGTLSGMVPGDVIDFLGSTVTNVQFFANTGSSGGTIVLLYNGNAVARLLTSSNFNNESFLTSSDGQAGTDILLTKSSGGSGGTGQTGTDPLVWTGNINGNWSVAANWNDTVTGKTATLPPGAQTPATISGPNGAYFQSIAGTGTCASLYLTGNCFLFGDVSAGTLTIGADATPMAAAIAGTLVTTVLTTLTAGQVLVADGAVQISANKTVMDVAGTLALGDGGSAPVLSFTQRAAGQFGGLSMGGGTLSVDATSLLEIGTLGGVATGALTVDPGFAVSGNGTVNLLGSTIDNGTITAAGGTLVLGTVSGTGSLVLGTEAALDLTVASALPIDMAGAGATLIIADQAVPSGLITGFAPGDSIFASGTRIDSVQYQPGAGGVGTLALSEAGVALGSLLLAGNYAGDSFAVQPEGQGAVVIVTAPGGIGGGGSGPPAGTVTPDQYVWTGLDGVLWADANNWIDSTQGQSPAEAAPGQNDSVVIAVPLGGAEEVVGPADAAALMVTGDLSLSGSFGVGTLAVGTVGQSGVLNLGAGDALDAASVSVLGGIEGLGGTLAIGGTLSLGETLSLSQQGGSAGVVVASGATSLTAEAVALLAVGSDLATDGTGTIEIGGAAGAAPGSVTVDQGGVVCGQGAVNPDGVVVDNGSVVASGGALAVGNVSGSGTLLVGIGATLDLEGAVGAGLVIDFAAAGTLNLAAGASGFDAGIADFGPSDSIVLPVSGATAAIYAATGPGQGVLSVLSGSQILAQLTLLGSQADLNFAVTGSAGGGTILTATPAKTAGEGGITVSNDPTVSGGFEITPSELFALAPFAESFLQQVNDASPHDNEGVYEYFLAGETTVVGPPFFEPSTQPGLDVQVVGPLTGEVGVNGFAPGSTVVLAAGYNAFIAQGNEPIALLDNSVGNSVLIGNSGAGTLAAIGNGRLPVNNDTLVGAPGANTVFYAAGGDAVTIVGGGDDTVTSTDNSVISTSGGQTNVFLGSSSNSVFSYGTDRVICGGTGIASDTVTGEGVAGLAGDTVFGPAQGSVVYTGGADAATVVGGGGQVVMTGGAANGNELWAGNSYAQYQGGDGSATVVGGDQPLVVQGGPAPTTVWGGTGLTLVNGTPGHSVFVVGAGASTVSAATGNVVWLLGSAQVSVAGASGVDAFGGLATGNNIFQANAGSETLWGGAGNDTFFAGSGDGTFVSGGGDDVFNFTNGLGGGTDEIVGFVPGADKIALHGYGNATPTLSVNNGNTYFTLSDGTDVKLYGITDLTPASFVTT